MNVRNLGRFFRTIRYLKREQIIGQIRVRLQRLWRDPERILRNVRGDLRLREREGFLNVPPPVPLQDPAAISKGDFQFINLPRSLGGPVDWAASGMPRLWQYNLHYFDWLWSLHNEGAEDWSLAKRFVLDWIENHPPRRDACGWEPYPTSLRLMNWALLFGIKGRPVLAADPGFRGRLLGSIIKQVRWLELNLETHIQGNHLLENLAALICVASVFEGDLPDRLFARYSRWLEAELSEQILPDGMHYERSPMYHLRILWLVNMLSEVGRPGVSEIAAGYLPKMKQALAMLRHPDGEIALFNDSALGVYLDSWRDEKPPMGGWSLPDAGYYGFRDDKGNYLIIDAGPIGPDYQPGHAHADFFSFELSLAGERVITDTGISTYETGEQRDYERSTAAHNTVEVEGENSVEVWDSFRVGRRVKPNVLKWEKNKNGFELDVEHKGFSHLSSQAVHRRKFSWTGPTLEIFDQLQLKAPASLISRLHFAPGIELVLNGNRVKCNRKNISLEIVVKGASELFVERSMSTKGFSRIEERSVLTLRERVIPPDTEMALEITLPRFQNGVSASCGEINNPDSFIV